MPTKALDAFIPPALVIRRSATAGDLSNLAEFSRAAEHLSCDCNCERCEHCQCASCERCESCER